MVKDSKESEKPDKSYFFVDEAGDPVFFNKYGKNIVGTEGCSKIILLGLIRMSDPDLMRDKISELRDEIIQDKYLEQISSIKKTEQSFHAKDDCPEVREKFYKLIETLDFKAEFFVGRKIEKIFLGKHKGKQNLFYDDLISKLFENKLHKTKHNIIYFATRGNRERQEPLELAIEKAKSRFEKKWDIEINSKIEILPQSPLGEPCLQVIDYMNWAVQRAFIKKEMRYFEFVREKVSYLVDVYDLDKYPKNYYNRSKNIFDINKISPL